MIEKLIENWLDNSGERGFETPFAQLLTAEGYVVVQGPVHHPFEHGKDILATAPDGSLHAYQLKGPGLTNLAAFEAIQDQLTALAGTAVTNPAVQPARLPDHVHLVTNSVLTPPVRDRIDAFNRGNVPRGWPPIEPIEREHLLARLIAAHGSVLPEKLGDIRTLLELHYGDGTAPFPVRAYANFLDDLLPFPPRTPSVPECRRAIASATLITGYASTAWQEHSNDLGVAQAWLSLCVTMLRFAEAHDLEDGAWKPSYLLAMEQARSSLAQLADEAAAQPDLVIPDIAEGVVYGHRALLVCGFLGAYILSELARQSLDAVVRDKIAGVLNREAQFVKIAGESSVPSFMLMATALEHVGGIATGEGMVTSLVRTISHANKRHSKVALADPHHDLEQVLLHQIGGDSDIGDEEFDGRSYMLEPAIHWMTRRLLRVTLAALWYGITEVEYCDFQPSSPSAYLAINDPEGELRFTRAARPQSWAQLLVAARTHDVEVISPLLRRHPELMPYVPLLFPHRYNVALSSAIDTL